MKSITCIFLLLVFKYSYSQEISKVEKFIKESVPYFQSEPTMFLKRMLQADSLLDTYAKSDSYYILKGKVKNNLGVYHWKNEKLKQGLNYLDSSLYYRKKINDIDGTVQSMVNMALIHNDLGDVYKAERTYNDALDFLESHPDTVLIVDVYNNLGVLFCGQDLYEKGHGYFVKALACMGESSSSSKATILNNIGSTLMEMDSLNASHDFFMRAFRIFEELNNRNGLASTIMNFGKSSGQSKEYDAAYHYYIEALSLYEETKNVSGKIAAYTELAANQLKARKLDEALSFGMKAKELLVESDKMATKQNLFDNLYEIHKERGESGLALNYYELSNQLLDSMRNEEFVRDALYREKQMMFKIEKDSINQAHEKQRIQEAGKIELERQIYLFTIIVISIILLFLILFIRNYRIRQSLIKENYIQEQLLNKQLESSLIEKSKMLTKESLKNLKSQKVIDEIDDILRQSNELNSEEINLNMRTIKSEIIENKLTQKKIESHSTFLEKENEEFTLQLKKMHPKLTPGDLKLCVLLRHNYSSDEICMMLSISSNTFSSAKYRIRRRMDLEKGERLQDYLLAL